MLFGVCILLLAVVQSPFNCDAASPRRVRIEEFNAGPDQIKPALNIWTSNPKGRVKLKVDPNDEIAKEPPVSVPGLMSRAVARWPNHPALSYKKDGVWTDITYSEYEKNVRTVAKAFLALGLERYHGVGIIGFNSPEWFYSDIGAIYAGGFAVGIYTTNTPATTQHNLELSSANICVVEDDKQAKKIFQIKNSLPNLKAIVQYTGTPTRPGVMSWEALMELGNNQDDSKLEAVLKTLAINECCTLVFTSGTEGMPKAVMLSHDNLTWNAYAAIRYFEAEYGVERVVSYLPLSHVAAQFLDIYIPLTVGGKVAFADRDALKDNLVKTLVEVKPTVFLGVPRIWEKIEEKITAIVAKSNIIKRAISYFANKSALKRNLNLMDGNNAEPYSYKFYRWLMFTRIKELLGLDKAKYCISGSAPISNEVKKYFMSIDIIISDAFGMSESSGAHTLSKVQDFRIDSIGRTIPGVETKLFNPDAEGQGEICMRGRHVMMGYLNEPQKTQDAVDAEGWLHSGDVGKIDKKGFLLITGRIKELLITAGGENIPPVPIEDEIKSALPCVSNAMVIGDKRKFLSVLLTLKTLTNRDTGAPLDDLTTDTKAWFKGIGVNVNTVTDVLNSKEYKKIKDAIQAGIDRANEQATSNAHRVQKFAILPKDFSIATEELGPTLKLKRPFVVEKYADIIESFY